MATEWVIPMKLFVAIFAAGVTFGVLVLRALNADLPQARAAAERHLSDEGYTSIVVGERTFGIDCPPRAYCYVYRAVTLAGGYSEGVVWARDRG